MAKDKKPHSEKKNLKKIRTEKMEQCVAGLMEFYDCVVIVATTTNEKDQSLLESRARGNIYTRKQIAEDYASELV